MQVQGDSSVAVALFWCVGVFICSGCFDIVFSSSLFLLVPHDGCALRLWHFFLSSIFGSRIHQ